MAVIVVVLLHVALFTGILFNACKQKDEAAEGPKSTAEQMAEIAGPAPQPKNESMPDPVVTPPIGSGGFNGDPIPAPVASLPISAPPIGVTPTGLANTGVPQPVHSAIPSPIPPAPVTGTVEHVVTKGDSFYSIGKKYGVGMNAVSKANPNIVPTRLRIGQKIIIPAATPKPLAALPPANSVPDAPNTYTVKKGDTLGHIALKHRTKVANLKSMNGLTSDFLKIGQKLTVPMRASAPALPTPIPSAPPALSPTTGLPISVPVVPEAVGPPSSSVAPPPPAE
ncbi:MAG: LysM peptidoglycan-binding domain-containing protein [Verrucomicrobia subdivision 3 bacterium]|nr:LysM peptidoglycan-binding domain-containing protein [Limisphaerales bacterium]